MFVVWLSWRRRWNFTVLTNMLLLSFSILGFYFIHVILYYIFSFAIGWQIERGGVVEASFLMPPCLVFEPCYYLFSCYFMFYFFFSILQCFFSYMYLCLPFCRSYRTIEEWLRPTPPNPHVLGSTFPAIISLILLLFHFFSIFYFVLFYIFFTKLISISL